jgi:lysozyme family protein
MISLIVRLSILDAKKFKTLGEGFMFRFVARLFAWVHRLFAPQSAPAKPISPPQPKPLAKTPALSSYRRQIQKLWVSAGIDPAHMKEVYAASQQVLTHRTRYEKVASLIGVPWYVIAVIHMREASFNFATHLSNGDPLFDSAGHGLKTVHVPSGLGPYACWEESAVAVCKRMQWHTNTFHWDIVNALENLEVFNGTGYFLRNMRSPYIWSMSTHAQRGKFVADGVFDPSVVDRQVGCAAVLLALKAHGVDLNEVIQ